MNRREFLAQTTTFFAAICLMKPSMLRADDEKDTTAEIFSYLISKASKEKWQMLPMGDLVSRIALEFLDTPYVGGTLEINPNKEQTIVNLIKFDCVTLFESSVGIARCIKKHHFRFTDMVDELTFLRYRDGKTVDYTSRLHYTSDWIMNNIKKGVVEDITEQIGGEEVNFNLNYMSQHPNSYPALKANPEFIPKIRSIEEELNRQTFHVVSAKDISSIAKNIDDGDIIAIATSSPGLDYSHTGLAFDKRLLHASSKMKKVIIDKSIASYVKSSKANIGISVLRPKEI